MLLTLLLLLMLLMLATTLRGGPTPSAFSRGVEKQTAGVPDGLAPWELADVGVESVAFAILVVLSFPQELAERPAGQAAVGVSHADFAESWPDIARLVVILHHNLWGLGVARSAVGHVKGEVGVVKTLCGGRGQSGDRWTLGGCPLLSVLFYFVSSGVLKAIYQEQGLDCLYGHDARGALGLKCESTRIEVEEGLHLGHVTSKEGVESVHVSMLFKKKIGQGFRGPREGSGFLYFTGFFGWHTST
jgi:hypothetical protein